MTESYFGGIEGGASVSTVVITNGKGEILAEILGEGTNPWILGVKPCLSRVNELIKEALKKADLNNNVKLNGLGLSLSGCEDAMFCKKIETQLKEFFPELTDEVIVVSDTLAPIALACQSGGAVIISGTGSNSLLVNPDFTTKRCGGYGHLLGDEGSAYWIAHKSIKTCVDHIEELNCAPNNYSIDNVWEAIKNHLKINTEVDLFSIFYGEDMEKSRIASLCKKIADLALKRDELSCWIFKEAGKELAKLVQTLYPSAHKVLHKENGGLHVVCVGSVWKSWDLLKNGFIEQLQNNSSKGFVQEFTLVVLDKTVALGGVYLIAKKLNYEFPFDYEHNYKILFHYVHNPNVSQ
ncbi:N-acetyl-D-glucosamine kinase-like [Daktulosphaira vitifoliae]|uniref:N-acetyl-D-glucosamine kinase-like n=1 Tax=Daktulosphaira vitifoliae TaxID=58002 RepID=UPI0021AAA6C8|nr:N-acetyl-D-glucosamine kinase-like [Daktulosphaira vitifoliae]XP_050533138.1 N-acetyl-D-glucosamine kinase-like [Daktulosphaira vitifoliae]